MHLKCKVKYLAFVNRGYKQKSNYLTFLPDRKSASDSVIRETSKEGQKEFFFIGPPHGNYVKQQNFITFCYFNNVLMIFCAKIR